MFSSGTCGKNDLSRIVKKLLLLDGASTKRLTSLRWTVNESTLVRLLRTARCVS